MKIGPVQSILNAKDPPEIRRDDNPREQSHGRDRREPDDTGATNESLDELMDPQPPLFIEPATISARVAANAYKATSDE
ncbi:MAG: hypothetical protein WCT46_02955 [Candidatus Gracilibacteria bacterium]|jgi:hypothetical protein